MKAIVRTALAVLILAGLAPAASVVVSSGDTSLANGVQLGSTAVQWNTGINGASGPTANFNIQPNSAWYGPVGPGGAVNSSASKWVSFIDRECAGPGCSSNNVPNFNNGDYVNFFHTFTLDGGEGGKLYILADDTADVYLTNSGGTTQLFTAQSTSGSACAGGIIGCISGTMGVVELGPYLTGGVNTLQFQVWQKWGTGFGLNYYAEIVPEPGFYGALALGFAGLYIAVQRRRKTNA